MMPMEISALGLMSGSSLDGLDLAFCRFTYHENKWNYTIEQAETIPYPVNWTNKLTKAHLLPASELLQLDVEYGTYLGEVTRFFIDKHHLAPDLIASHGHTIFHEPHQGFSFQLGKGSYIAQTSGKITVSDFRNTDILHGGQGAPLVPIGDELLFREYSACINVGGIANISYRNGDNRIGYDVCAANQLLNALSMEMDLPYDENGKIASTGIVIENLLQQLNDDPFFTTPKPKSLSNQVVKNKFVNAVLSYKDSIPNRLATVVQHISQQLADELNQLETGKILITGGGAHNAFLMESISKLIPHELIVPNKTVVDFKEALIFAFMGVLRIQNQINCLASVTGASCDSSSGIIDHP